VCPVEAIYYETTSEQWAISPETRAFFAEPLPAGRAAGLAGRGGKLGRLVSTRRGAGLPEPE